VYAAQGFTPSQEKPVSFELYLDNLRLELRRGSLVVAVLQSLREEKYGYTLRADLVAAGIPIDEGTLYPLLRRLEAQSLLGSEWREEEKRRKRFYRLSPEGRQVLDILAVEWRVLNASVETLFAGHGRPERN
jgi:PadR family transcriptional regulator, regulatory protein PadR